MVWLGKEYHILEVSTMTTERTIRCALNKAGYRLCKSRKSVGADNLGGYMIVDLIGNFAVAGMRYDLSLDDVRDWLEQ